MSDKCRGCGEEYGDCTCESPPGPERTIEERLTYLEMQEAEWVLVGKLTTTVNSNSDQVSTLIAKGIELTERVEALEGRVRQLRHLHGDNIPTDKPHMHACLRDDEKLVLLGPDVEERLTELELEFDALENEHIHLKERVYRKLPPPLGKDPFIGGPSSKDMPPAGLDGITWSPRGYPTNLEPPAEVPGDLTPAEEPKTCHHNWKVTELVQKHCDECGQTFTHPKLNLLAPEPDIERLAEVAHNSYYDREGGKNAMTPAVKEAWEKTVRAILAAVGDAALAGARPLSGGEERPAAPLIVERCAEGHKWQWNVSRTMAWCLVCNAHGDIVVPPPKPEKGEHIIEINEMKIDGKPAIPVKIYVPRGVVPPPKPEGGG